MGHKKAPEQVTVSLYMVEKLTQVKNVITVGLKDGRIDGSRVGFSDGDTVGISEGNKEGIVDGDVDGLIVGS